MKKIVSLVLTAVVLCTLLSVLVLPASAETETKTAGEMADDYMAAGIDLEYEGQYEDAADAYLKAANLYEDADDPDSAAEAYQNAGRAFTQVANLYGIAGNSVAAADAYMKAGECYEKAGKFSNAAVAFTSAASQYNDAKDDASAAEAYIKAGKCLEKAGELSIAKTAFNTAETALQRKLKELQDGFAGSILSGGSLVIIVGVACLVVGALGMYLIMKKKKPAVAGGEKNEE